MNRLDVGAVLLIVTLILSSCSLPSGHGLGDLEEKVLDENLKLKEKVAELEERLAESEAEEQWAEEAGEDLYHFFAALNKMDTEEVKRRLAGKAEVIPGRGLRFENGCYVGSNGDRQSGIFNYFRVTEAKFGVNRGSLSYEFLTDGNKAQTERMVIEVILDNNIWKVESCSPSHASKG